MHGDSTLGAFETQVQRSRQCPEAFWLEAAKAIDWTLPPSSAFDPVAGWFPDGRLNTCHNALDRHVAAGMGDAVALIYDSPVTGTCRTFSYAQLLAETGRVAAMLGRMNVAKGDRVVIYMPMVPETVFAMLACARIGAIHSVVFGGFAALELAKRIDDAKPKVLLTASCGIEGSRVVPYKPLVDEALDLAEHSVGNVVTLQREAREAVLDRSRDLDWSELREEARDDPVPDCAELGAGDPLYIIYTSGTTGTPKGVVRDNGGHAVALAWSMANVYGVGRGDTFWAASDVGWVVGHSYIVYAPLLVGATSDLFEGKPVGTPDAGTYWRTIVRHRVRIFFSAPTAVRAIRKEDPEGHLLKAIGTGNCLAFFLAGERADPDTISWLEEKSGLPVFDHWWQTELGWPAIATCFALGDERRRRGSAGFALPGYEFSVLGEDGEPLPDGRSGSVVIAEPLPPGAFRALWNNREGYERNFATFPGSYETGDAGFRDSDGFLHIMGRTDDIINVAGHRLSTGQMEQIVAAAGGIAECAVVGAQDVVKGMIPICFVVPLAGAEPDEALRSRVVDAVRSNLGPVAALKRVIVVGQLPKTRSGKILRNLLRQITDGEDWQIPSTIEDPVVPQHIAEAFDQSSVSSR